MDRSNTGHSFESHCRRGCLRAILVCAIQYKCRLCDGPTSRPRSRVKCPNLIVLEVNSELGQAVKAEEERELKFNRLSFQWAEKFDYFEQYVNPRRRLVNSFFFRVRQLRKFTVTDRQKINNWMRDFMCTVMQLTDVRLRELNS